MSRLWIEPSSLFLGRAAMALRVVTWRTRRQPALVMEHEGFDGRVEKLSGFLAQCPHPIPRLSVVLSNHDVRFQLVEPEAGIKNQEELRAWAKLGFEREAGMEPDRIDLQLGENALRGKVLACAIDIGTRDAILTALKGVDVRSIQPLFVSIFNHCAKSLTSGVVAVVEPGRIVLGAIVKNQWHCLASRFVTIGDRSALVTLMQDYLAGYQATPKLWLYDPAQEVDQPLRPWETALVEVQHTPLNIVTAALAS